MTPAQPISRHSILGALPTREATALRAVFGGTMMPRGREHPMHARPLQAFGAPIHGSDGSIAHWLTRVEGIATHALVSTQCLSVSHNTPQAHCWTMGLSDPQDPRGEALSPQPFWALACEAGWMAHCVGGTLTGARKLFDAVERLFSATTPLTSSTLQDLDGLPLQAMLYEFEPEGLGMVHFSYARSWEADGLLPMDLALRADSDAGFDELPWSYFTQDVYGRFDEFCSDDFIERTSPELALAIWSHLWRQPDMQLHLERLGDFHRMPALLERQQLNATVLEGPPSRPCPPRI